MKSRFAVAIVIIMVAHILLLPTQGVAQNPEICKPDCSSSEFSATQTTVVQLSNGCWARVKYAQRLACGIWNDVGIISIELLSGCAGVDVLTGVTLATEAILLQNPMGFPEPDTGACVMSWRVVKGACWMDSVSWCDDQDTLLVPCVGEACCLSPYKVCRDSLGEKYVIELPSTLNGECDTLLPFCIPVCGESSSAAEGGDPDLGIHNRASGHPAHDSHPRKSERGESVALGRESVSDPSR